MALVTTHCHKGNFYSTCRKDSVHLCNEFGSRLTTAHTHRHRAITDCRAGCSEVIHLCKILSDVLYLIAETRSTDIENLIRDCYTWQWES